MTKGKKVGTFFLGLAALPIALLIQVIVTVPLAEAAVGVAIVNIAHGSFSANDVINYYYELVSGQTFLETVQFLYSIAAAGFFLWWFKKAFFAEHGPFFRGHRLFFRPLIGLILLMIGLQFAVTVLYDGVAAILPGAAEAYEDLVELAGFDEPTVAILIYGIFLGPIAEELIFRGVALHYFKRILPFWAANLFQAVLFGVYHMNLMQGIYAAVVGLVLGYIFYRGGSLLYSITAHIIFNFFGFTNILYLGSDSPYYNFFWMPIMVLTLILGSMLYFREKGVAKI